MSKSADMKSTLGALKRFLEADIGITGDEPMGAERIQSSELWGADFQSDLLRMSCFLVFSIAIATSIELTLLGTQAQVLWTLQAILCAIAITANVAIRTITLPTHFLHFIFGSAVALYFLQAINGAPLQILWSLPIVMAWSMVLQSTVAILLTFFILGLVRWVDSGFVIQPAYLMFILAGFFATHALKSQLMRLSDMAAFDALTGALNRRFFKAQAKRLIAEYAREARPSTLVYIDLDGFKGINDAFGHAEGDRVLEAFVAVILRRIRKTDMLYRMGGDEFVLVLTNTPLDSVSTLLVDIQSQIGEIDVVRPQHISACFGVASVTSFADPSDWISAADTALRAAKKKGPNTIEFSQG